MKKQVAIAIDGSVNCTQAVQYAVAMYKSLPELSYVLVHVQAGLSRYLTEEAEKNLKAKQALNKLMKANRETSKQVIDKVRQQMIRQGIDPDRIETCSRIQTTGIAEDLVDECEGKAYDAVVLGRRGIGQLQELVMGSVTSSLVELTNVVPLWIVDGEVTDNGVVLAADGSQNSLRALDHLAFMLSGLEGAAIHILHVRPRFREVCEIECDDETMAAAREILLDGDRHCIDGFYSQAVEIVRKNGLDPDQMEIQTVNSQISIAGALIDTARKRRFGTIVVGRRGLKKGRSTGSISRKIIQKSNKMAVWLVP